MDRLFDPGESLKPSRRQKPLAAAALSKGAPIFAVAIGTVTEYVRAYDEHQARDIWRQTRHRQTVRDIPDEDIKVHRMLHADLVALEKIDRALASRLRRL